MRKLISYSRIFYNWKLTKSIYLNYPPEDISIEITNRCNFKCSFCPQSDSKHFDVVQRTVLSPEQAKVLIKKLREGGVKTNVIHWTLDGEPFINKQLHEICRIAIKYGFVKIIFSTNAYFCTPNRLSELPKGEDVEYTLWVDFCADKEFFEKYRGTPGSWEKIKTNLLRILDNDTFKHIYLGIIDISSWRIKDKATLGQSVAKLKDIFHSPDRLTIHTRIFHNVTGFISGIKEEKQSLNSRYNLCPYPWTSMVIASNGDVVACCRDLQHKTVLGNLFDSEMLSIWNGEKYQDIRKALANQEPQLISACKDCDLPYDKGKFSIQHILKTIINRLGILKN